MELLLAPLHRRIPWGVIRRDEEDAVIAFNQELPSDINFVNWKNFVVSQLNGEKGPIASVVERGVGSR